MALQRQVVTLSFFELGGSLGSECRDLAWEKPIESIWGWHWPAVEVPLDLIDFEGLEGKRLRRSFDTLGDCF